MSSAQAIAAALSSRAHIVHLHDPELVWAVPLLRLAGRRVVYDAHEDLPDQVLGKRYLGSVGRRAATVLAHAVVALAGRADAVVAATPAIARRFPAARTTIVRNVPQLRAADAAATPAGGRPPVAVYIGALSGDRGLGVLADVAASGALPPGWRIATAGTIDPAERRGRFDELVAAGRIEHHGRLEQGAARDLLLGARIGLLPLRPTPAFATSIPTKLFEYLAAGLAVIATDIPFWRSLLGDVECVTWVPADDSDAVVRAIRRYEADPDLLAAHGSAGPAVVRERFRWDRESETLLVLYRSLCAASPVIERSWM